MKNITHNFALSGSSIKQVFYHAPADTYSINRILEETPAISPWVIFVLSITAGIIVLFAIYTFLLRNRIETRSRALEESEKRFRRYFMTSKDPVFITSKEGEWLDVNLATVRLFGFESKEELLTTSVQQVYKNPEDRSNLLSEVDQRGFVKDFQVDLVDRHGKVLHTILTTTVIKNNKGAVIGYQGTIRDQSEWLSTQEKIRQSQESLDLALTGTGAGYWDWNIKTNTININDRWADMIGYEKSELTPLTVDTWERLSHPEDLEQFNRLILKHFAGDLYHYQSEIRMKHKNGNWVWILNQGRVVEREPDRSPLRMVGTTQDITERVQAREEIQEFAEQLEALHVITKSLSSTLSLKELLQLILVKLEETLAFDSASIFLYENEELRIETVHNHPNPELVVGKTFSTSNPLFQEIQRDRNPIIIDNAMKDARFQGWGKMHHVKGWMGIPLVIQDTFIGYITLDSKKSSAFGSYEAKIANLFASQAAQAIHNARLYERVTQYAETLETSIEERTQELSKMVDHMAGRELRMAELKDVIERLRDQLINNDLDPEAQDPLKERTSNI